MKSLSKQKRAIRRAMRKPRDMSFNPFAARLTKINNFLPLLPESDHTENMPDEELNKILLRVVLNGWVKQSYLQGLYS